MDDNKQAEDSEKAQELISFGSEITGSAIGGALGFFAGVLIDGPLGGATAGVAGAIAGRAVHVVGDIARRHLSRREKVRVGAGLTFACIKIAQHLEEGRSPRNDDFFDANTSIRSSSDEILEGVLLKCKSEHEEKKVKLIGNIYANIVFMPEVSAFGANWLLQTVESLTYRQLCIIALVGRKDNHPFSRGASWGPRDGDPAFQMEYEHLGASMFAFDRDRIPDVGETYVDGLSRAGQFCYTAMSLDEIPEDDLRQLSSRFQWAFE